MNRYIVHFICGE